MTNIFDYIKWRGDLAFENDKFNEVDGLILSALSYLPFEHVLDLIPTGATVSEVCTALLNVDDIESKVLFKNDLTLMSLLSDSVRFGSLVFFDYQSVTDHTTQSQFAAITLSISPNLHVIAYRGTDDSFVGWKEDFNMAFMSPVPSQTLAVEYLKTISAKIKGKFILTGHSKGGNIAIYAGAFSKKRRASRIQKIYNYDGPGFDERVLTSDEYNSITHLVSSFVPQSSVIGMLLEHTDDYVVVHSSQVGILQHDHYSWNVQGKSFICLDKVTGGSKFIDRTLASWLKTQSYEQRQQFIEAVYSILSETNALTLRELGGNWFAGALAITKTIRNLDEETKKQLSATLKSLGECVKNNFISSRKQ